MFSDGSVMGAGMVLLWVLVIVVLVLVIKALIGSGSPPPGQRETPLDILKARYARGEIDEEEFHRRREELEK